MAAVVGVLAGLSAAAMEWGLHAGMERLVGRVADHASASYLQLRWGVLLLPAAGGLLSGIVVLLFCPNLTGHGTSILTRAFHRGGGVLPWREPAVKAAACVGVISCGGSAGPEGPIAALGAGLGSSCAGLFRATPRERRIMLLAGCAAGIGAIFRCPLGGALFAVSLPYSEPEYESEAIVPSVVASVIGYSAFMAVWGNGHYLLGSAAQLAFTSPRQLLPFVLLGPLCGLVAIFFGQCFQAVEWLRDRMGWMPRWLAPALGGLATGGLACLLPQVMDGRYELLQSAMDETLFARGPQPWLFWAGLFGAVTLAKCLATAFTVGSGAAGGVLGPALFIGGSAGAFLGASCEAVAPGILPEPLRQALIPMGMGGVLAACMRTPLAAIVMVLEMTGTYRLIAPSMLVCVAAYVVGRRWGLNREQVPTSAESPVHAADAVVHLLQHSRVEDFADRQWPQVVAPATPLGEMIRRIAPGDPPAVAVVDNGALCGMITLADLDRDLNDAALARMVIAQDIMNDRYAWLHPDDDLYHALELFRREGQTVLPVVGREEPRAWLGMLTRHRVFAAVKEQIEKSRDFLLQEYEGLLAIDQEARLDNLLLAVSPAEPLRLKRLSVPGEVVGRSIRASDFRARYGSQIVAVEEPDGSIQCPPDPDRPLGADLRVLAIVPGGEPARGRGGAGASD